MPHSRQVLPAHKKLAPKVSCMDAWDLAAAHLHGLRSKMRELKAHEVWFHSLRPVTRRARAVPDCVILGDLGKHCGCGSSDLLPMT
jgi:hypothetical protein